MNIRFTAKFVPILAILVFCSVNTFAWDDVGHKLTAYIAWQQMTPDARERVFRILINAPEDSHLSTPYDAFNSRSDDVKKLELFMFASIWPDVVRNRAFEVRNEKYNQSNWHYGDIFWRQEGGKANILADFEGAGGFAVSKLSDFEKIMRDPSYRDEEKAIAIAWFLHVGGDLHNPLHNASRVTDTEPEGDQGGNLFVLVPRTDDSFGLNLHSYWDSIISRVKPRKNDDWDTRYLAPIARKFMKKHKPLSMNGRLNIGKYAAWNLEGFRFLNSVVYSDIERGSPPSKKYQKRAFRVSREQITLAGYRLGETLNRIFAAGPN
ncbi:MAG: S1/P1 nuclease [Acidobacteriota bacterium]|nr:S1/P1 nuclease [Acidobacteriota bacterium]MDH3528668.1 S1/P1 nuclease [Acidobacteriota bacterium]